MRELTLAVVLVSGIAPAAPTQESAPNRLVDRAREAMGGERLASLATIRLSGLGYTNALEQSERPEGPWIKSFDQFTELRDLRRLRLRRTTQSRSGAWSPDWSPELVLLADTGAALWARAGRAFPARAADRAAAVEALFLSPERLLTTAAAAPELRSLPDTVVAGVRNHRLAFRFGERRAVLYLDAHTLLPSGYVLHGPAGGAFGWMWGDAREAVWFSLWSFDPPGIRYPRMVVTELNGQPLREVTLTAVRFDAPAPPDSFPLPDSARAAFAASVAREPSMRHAPLGRSFTGAVVDPIEVADGVTIFPGPWYTAVIRQGEGLVVIDAPISPEYSTQLLAEAERRYGGEPVRGVVTTSDAWPHLAGIREYVARGIPVHHLDLNRSILERFVAARWGSAPDALERSRRAPIWRPLATRATLGTGPNRMELIPVRGEGGERMLMVWLPEHRLLYASDLIQRQRDGTFFWPEYLVEVIAAARREGLDVERVWAMHTDPLPWRDILDAVEAVRATPVP